MAIKKGSILLVRCHWCKNPKVVGEKLNDKGRRLFLCPAHFRMAAFLNHVIFYGSMDELNSLLGGHIVVKQ